MDALRAIGYWLMVVGFFFELLFDELHEHIDSGVIVSALGDDDVRIAFAGLNKLLVHGFEDTLVAIHDCLDGASALYNIALCYTDKAVVGIRVHENLEVHLLAKNRVVQRHDTFNDDNLARVHMNGLLLARGGDVIVDWLLDGFAIFEQFDVFGKECPIEGIWVVEIDVLTLLKRHMATIVIVGVLRNNDYFALWKALNEFAYHGCFS